MAAGRDSACLCAPGPHTPTKPLDRDPAGDTPDPNRKHPASEHLGNTPTYSTRSVVPTKAARHCAIIECTYVAAQSRTPQRHPPTNQPPPTPSLDRQPHDSVRDMRANAPRGTATMGHQRTLGSRPRTTRLTSPRLPTQTRTLQPLRRRTTRQHTTPTPPLKEPMVNPDTPDKPKPQPPRPAAGRPGGPMTLWLCPCGVVLHANNTNHINDCKYATTINPQ